MRKRPTARRLAPALELSPGLGMGLSGDGVDAECGNGESMMNADDARASSTAPTCPVRARGPTRVW
jgi:hypothetical protein